MEDVAGAVHRGGDQVAVAHVALGDLECLAFDIGARAGGAQQDAHRVAPAGERARDGGSDETAGAGDKDLVAHQLSLVSARRPSMACQASSTGTPTAMSRARLSSETASPISGPRPNSGISAA